MLETVTELVMDTAVQLLYIHTYIPLMRIAPTIPQVNTRPWCSNGT